MKVVFIGCEPFKGTDICGFQYSFYEQNFKPGDILQAYDHYGGNISDAFNDKSSIIRLYMKKENTVRRGVFPIKYFIPLEQWREMRLNDLGI